jgi:hypothetical protein
MAKATNVKQFHRELEKLMSSCSNENIAVALVASHLNRYSIEGRRIAASTLVQGMDITFKEGVAVPERVFTPLAVEDAKDASKHADAGALWTPEQA